MKKISLFLFVNGAGRTFPSHRATSSLIDLPSFAEFEVL